MVPSVTTSTTAANKSEKATKASPALLYLLPPPPSQAYNMVKLQPPSARSSKARLLRHPRRTNLFVWFTAFLCIGFSLMLILAGIATLVLFLVVKPRNPLFDITSASLSSIYLDTPQYLNGDLTLQANFSNPNRKIDVKFEHLSVDLFFFDQLIATQGIQPFRQRRGELRVETVRMISSEVNLPLNLSLQLQKQVQSNRVAYYIRGEFRVRASFGLVHFSYWLHGRCQIELTAPPTGVLISHRCRTRR